ncbi:MAG: ABC transporter permease [Pyrinomonadaceae bacterium]|nr:ABC transporter permease [Pyrinomonadaceae bacterium]
MSFFDVLRLAMRNLREAKLRVVLTTLGVVVGVAVIVTMVSFGLGLQRNTVSRFKALDLFNEVTVYGRNIASLVAAQFNQRSQPGEGSERREEGNRNSRRGKPSERSLDDAALDEIARIPGVAYVEPNLTFSAYVRTNNRALQQQIGGARVPNAASRFQNFAAGRMLDEGTAGEAVVDENFLRAFDYKQASDAIGQEIQLLAPRERAGARADENSDRTNEDARARRNDDVSRGANENEEEDSEGLSFFGLPLEGDDASNKQDENLAGQTFRIVGVLKDELSKEDGGGSRRFRGLMPPANIYIPLDDGRRWVATNRGMMDEVALRLARESGALKENESLGYNSATVRVTDPVVMNDVVKRLDEFGFNSFGIFSQLDQIRTFFLIINAALGLLGGISLLVASLGIANTMIMSILERTREIGIMKAIGAEDREIKMIFFVEAGVIGLAGGVAGSLLAWGIDAVANRLAYEFFLKPQGASYVDFFALPPYLWLGAILFAVVVSIVAALYPAARAARIDPVKALRHD